jgi:hypothetical protein
MRWCSGPDHPAPIAPLQALSHAPFLREASERALEGADLRDELSPHPPLSARLGRTGVDWSRAFTANFDALLTTVSHAPWLAILAARLLRRNMPDRRGASAP